MTNSISESQLRKQVKDKKNWYHSINFGNNIVSQGQLTPATQQQFLNAVNLPSLQRKTVLDIGAWDGFYSFEAERRGAQVTALDSWCWNGKGRGDKKGFNLAHKWFKSDIKTIELEVIDICPEKTNRHDIVFFFGVLYHMRHPLEKAASVANELIIVETAIDLKTIPKPAAAFYPTDELAGDKTNWWGLNPPAVLGMLKALGLKNAKMTHYRHWGNPKNPNQGRGIFYAYK